MLLFLVLFLAALPLRFANTPGDFWGDEADYAMASTHGFQANRWDISDDLSAPEKLVRMRHFHPPLIVDVLGLTHHWGASDRTLRIPFVLLGGLTVGLVYLCGVALFDQRREIGIACAILLLFAPPHIRASSHALPWSFITFNLTLMLWTLIEYTKTRRSSWLVAGCATLGLMFVTSEMFFTMLLATGCTLPVLFWSDWRQPEDRRRILFALALGFGIFLAIAFTFWPIGLFGGSWRMLSHYMGVAGASIPVNVAGHMYERAPRWAYLSWYTTYYLPFLVFYLLGTFTALFLTIRKELSGGAGVLMIFSAIILASAHKAHIIGPEYLVHCLPTLTLLGGFFFLMVGRLNRGVCIILLVAFCVHIALWKEHRKLSGMDSRSQISRWPAAARFLAEQWKPGDRLLIGPQTTGVANWYLAQYAGVPVQESQIRELPTRNPKAPFLARFANGDFRFVVLSSAVSDKPSAAPQLMQMLKSWSPVWKSDEHGTGPVRLTIYEIPSGVSPETPLDIPTSNPAPAVPPPAQPIPES